MIVSLQEMFVIIPNKQKKLHHLEVKIVKKKHFKLLMTKLDVLSQETD